jgi:hypothetical protein
MDTLISLGSLPVKIDNTELGSVISTQVSISPEMVNVHDEKVKGAVIAPNKIIMKKFNGSLSASTEDIVQGMSLVNKLLAPIKGDKVLSGLFDCQLVKGEVYLIPQFSIATSIDGWSSIGFNLPLKSLIPGTCRSAINTACSLPLIQPSSALTNDKNKLCPAMTCNNLGISSISVSCNCGYELIYTDASSDSIDCVLNTFDAVIDFGIYDCTSIAALTGDVDVSFKLISGTETLSFKNCTSMISGVTTSNGVDTWNVRTYGVLS